MRMQGDETRVVVTTRGVVWIVYHLASRLNECTSASPTERGGNEGDEERGRTEELEQSYDCKFKCPD